MTQSCRSTPANAWNGEVLDPRGPHHGVKFFGGDGTIFVTRGRIEASDPDLLTQPLPAGAERLPVSDNHMGNFLDCLRSRKAPVCDVEIGHRSASVCHLGTIAIRMGRRLKWDPQSEEFAEDRDANAWLAREMRHPWNYDAV